MSTDTAEKAPEVKETVVEAAVEAASANPEIIVPGSIEEVGCLVKALVPIIYVVSHEEDRFIKEVWNQICNGKRPRDLYLWSSYQGLVKYTENMSHIPKRASGEFNETWNPQKALAKIEEIKHAKNEKHGSVFVLRDFHTVLAQPIPRQMRDMYEMLIAEGKTIIILAGQLAHGPGASKSGMEPSLEKQVSIVRYSLPTREQIELRLRNLIADTDGSKNKKLKRDYTDEEYFTISRALQGLTYNEIENAASISMAYLQRLDPKRLMTEKKQIIMRSDILEYIESSADIDQIGGMDDVKKYFADHDNSNSEEAAAFGVEPLKGILLTGIPGTGKSQLAKALGNRWGIPTLRLDVGKVMTGLVGGSEEKMRAVVSQATSVAPCVLWIDEIEKSLSGTKSSNYSDGGTLARVFGTLLTSMEEGLKGVTIVATANDITMLPPELIRRFNEVYFVDMPVAEEREEIFGIHLTKRKRDPKKFDMKRLGAATEGYTGAEVEKAVKECIAKCFNDGRRELTTEDLLQAIKETKPISVVMGEKVSTIRQWARDRARYASTLAAKAAAPGKQMVKTASGKGLSVADAVGDMETKSSKKNKKDKEDAPTGSRFDHAGDNGEDNE